MSQLILNCFIVRPKISAIMVEVPRKCKWHVGRRRAAPRRMDMRLSVIMMPNDEHKTEHNGSGNNLYSPTVVP